MFIVEFFLTVENNLDAIQFDDTSKKEMVKPSLYVWLRVLA